MQFDAGWECCLHTSHSCGCTTFLTIGWQEHMAPLGCLQALQSAIAGELRPLQ